MKKYIISSLVIAVGLFAVSCKQELITLNPPPEDPAPETPSKGTANFSKFVAVGSSYTAGFQAGALFNEGQANSLPAILNKQFALAGAPETFNQPSINTELGYNIFVTPNPMGPVILGRFLLQYNGAASPKPTPQVSDVSALPNPGVNPGFIYGNGSTKASLNNFGVEAIMLGQALITQTGNWAGTSDPRFSPFYARLEYPGDGSATLVSDIQDSQATFLMFWLGMDDYMLYAAQGGDAKKAPLNSPGAFDAQYKGAIALIKGAIPDIQMVLGNYPEIFTMPHFTSVPYNPIPLDADHATAVMGGFSGYNAALSGIIANAGAFGLTEGQVFQLNTRMIQFSESANNAVLIYDTDMFDLGPYFDGLQGLGAITPTQRAALAPYQRVRQTTSADILPLSAGSILGTLKDANPQLVYGVSVPLADQFVIVPSERDSIEAARTAFNGTVGVVQGDNNINFTVADVQTLMATLVTAHAGVYNGVTITPNINPPTGIYSEDGLHPNSRGYAFISRAFISAINDKFGAKIPQTDISLYGATALPIP